MNDEPQAYIVFRLALESKEYDDDLMVEMKVDAFRHDERSADRQAEGLINNPINDTEVVIAFVAEE